MADIRINALATTASSTASDDFLAVDGSANGTRKLSAYSPTFGGNLTVSGTGTNSFGGLVKATGNAATSFGVEIVNSTGAAGTAQHYLTAGNGAGFTAFRLLRGNGAAGYEDNGFNADSFSGARFNLNALGGSGGNFTISGGNLLIGTTTDGGQKLQVSGTATISGGIVGTTTNDSAAAGIVGQYVSSTVASGSAVSLSNGTAANVTSISLTAGDWDVSAKVGFKPNASTTISYMLAAVSDTSTATTEANRIVLPLNGATTAYNVEATVPTVRISIASTTTIYLVASSEFAVSTQSAFGTIIARRVR